MDWQPIETIPKDGTPVLTIGKHADGDWMVPEILMWDESHQCLQTEGGYSEAELDMKFSADYWMSLPAPPTVQG